MKKIIIASILSLLLTLTIIIKSVDSKAETPDLFMMNEIYLYDYDNFNFSPNFENDYLLNATILPKDLESSLTSFIGWYKDLGYWQLLVPYYGDDVDNDHWVYFAVPCYDVIAANFQLAYYSQEPMAIQFGVNFTDGTNQLWDTETNGYGAQLLRISKANIQKNIECFWWSAKTADYVPSFKFLGVTDGYDIGYQHGENTGYDTGYNVGYSLGFRNGFQDGITQSEDVVIYESILNFNQMIRNGNFENTDYWTPQYSTFSVDNFTATITANSSSGRIQQGITPLIIGHKYLIHYKIDVGLTFRLRDTANDINANFGYNVPMHVFTADSSYNSVWLYTTSGYVGAPLNAKNIYIIDLTIMYGEGYEPTLEQCQQIFTTEYYPFTSDIPVQMGYFTGFFDGRDDGLSQGINIGESNQINMNWIQSIFAAIQGVLSIQIFPKVTIGVIVGIPFIISLAWFIIRMFRGGGGGE